MGTASAGAPSCSGGDWFGQSPEPPAGPEPGRALVPAHLSSYHFPQLPCGIGREAGVRAFGACLRLLVQTTSTNTRTRCPSLSSPRPLGLGGLKRPSWHPRGYLLAVGHLPSLVADFRPAVAGKCLYFCP